MLGFFFLLMAWKYSKSLMKFFFEYLKQAEAVTVLLAIIFENSWKKEGIPGGWGKTNIVPTLLKKKYIYIHHQ